MIRFAREFRLIPIVLLATVSLLVLKVSGLVLDGGYTLGERLQGRHKASLTVTSADSVPDYPKIVIAGQSTTPDKPAAKVPWAQEMFGFNESPKGDVTGSVAGPPAPSAGKIASTGGPADAPGDITGSAGGGEKKADSGEPPLKVSEKRPDPPKLEVAGDTYPLQPGAINSPGERAVLGRLQDRRQELENRNRQLDMRESLIKAAEKRLEAKVEELKELEARVKAATGARDKAEAQRFGTIVAMYENMKPKEAARIFDRLDLKILVDVTTQINPRKMSEILAQMTPEAAERLTVELASRAGSQAKTQDTDQLPKIEGRPTRG